MSDLVDDPTGKYLKVKLIQKKGKAVDPAYLFDAGSKIEWTPNADKLTSKDSVSYVGVAELIN